MKRNYHLRTEKWKTIKGYEGLYEISTFGNVWSLKRNKILSPADNGNGYLYVNLHKDGKGVNYKIHRLVALTFIPNPDNLTQVNHKDLDKTNNCVWNLEWCSPQYNQKHWLDIKRPTRNRDKAILISQRVLKFNTTYPSMYKESCAEAMRKYRENGYIPDYIYNEDLF